MYSLTFSIDELNTLLHPTEKHRELKAQELTDRDRISRDIMKDWTKSRLALWMATNTEFELFRTDANPRDLADNLENLEILPYIHRTCFSNHKNISLSATLEKESYLTEDDRLRHRTYLSIKLTLTRQEYHTPKFSWKERPARPVTVSFPTPKTHHDWGSLRATIN